MKINFSNFRTDNINSRIFIVGCSRSGTTLLQSILATHPSIKTFPETGFFLKSIGNLRTNKILANIGITTGKELKSLNDDILYRLNAREKFHVNKKPSFKYKENVKIFLSILDYLTLQSNKKIWIEKTPLHILNLEIIEKYVPKVKIIHIVRDGKEVVASIYKRHINYPNKFVNQDINYGIKLWNKCMHKTLKQMNESNNFIVKYEDLVGDTNKELNKISAFLNLNEKDFDINKRKDIPDLKFKNEEWKNNSIKKIENKNTKFTQIFTKEEQNYIKKKLKNNIIYKFN